MLRTGRMMRLLGSLNSRVRSHSSGPVVGVSLDAGVAVVTLRRPPLNTLNLEMLQSLGNILDDLERRKVKGMILTSACPTIFSAGLDVKEMYKPDMNRFKQFYTSLQDVWLKLYGSTYPTVAAINGDCFAGGYLLAMSCERRAMVAGGRVGLTEAALGLPPPQFCVDTLLQTVPPRQAELALTTSTIYDVDEALQVGLIDETATDNEDCMAKCMEFLKRFDKVDPSVRSAIKLKIRSRTLERMTLDRAGDLEFAIQYIDAPEVQKTLEVFVNMSKAKFKER